MTTQSGEDSRVNRLVDMVVEEVSLVDRAANNRKFLIVKRDQFMDEALETDKAAEGSAGDGTTADTSDSTEGDALLVAAVAALESLTSIVEVLSDAGAADPRLGELAQQLRDTADQILGQVDDDSASTETTDNADEGAGDLAAEAQAKAKTKAGTPGKGKSKPASPQAAKSPKKGKPDSGGASGENAKTSAAKADEFATAKATLATLTKLIEGLAKAQPPTEAASNTNAPAELLASVSKLTEAVQQLTKSVGEQQQRIGRVEKQVGLPNSAAPAERVAKTNDEAVGWPLDLNHPMDREHVDKSVSFHE